MGIFNKIIRKGQKGLEKERKLERVKKEETAEKKDLTLTELKDKMTKKADGKKPAEKVVKETVKKEDTKDAYKVLLRPLATEKGTYLGTQNKYIFEVAKSANKIEIKKAIHAVYGVLPLSVNIVNLLGKKVRYGKTRGKNKDSKKAIVTLKKNETIQIYEGV